MRRGRAPHRQAGTLVGVLALAMALGGFSRSILPALSTFITEGLDLTRSEFGFLITAKMLALTLAVGVSGRMVDRVGGRRMLAFRAIGAALAMLGLAWAQSYLSMIIAVALAGICLSSGNPASNKLIAVHLPAGRKGTAVGIKQSGAQLGTLLAGATLPALAVATSWRVAVTIGLLIPALSFISVVGVLPPDPIGATRSSGELSVGHRDGLRRLAVVGFLMGAGTATVFAFIPLFATQAVGMSPAEGGGVLAVTALVGTVSRVVWGTRSELATSIGRPLVILAAVSVAATVTIAASQIAGPWMLWLGAVMAGASMEAWNAVGNFGAIASVHTKDTGRASGQVMLGFLAGGAVSPYLFGLLADLSGGYAISWTVSGLLFLAAAVLSWIWYESGWRESSTLARTQGR